MLTTIDNVLTSDQLARIRALANEALFEDGRKTASGLAREVKYNEQMTTTGEAAAEVGKLLTDALLKNDTLRAFALPAAMQLPRLSRYAAGMNYGYHVDAAFMGDPMVRTDVSVTLFISEPESYDGGELVIDGPWGRVDIKRPAGSLVAYPASTLHRVTPVTRGERLVALTWIKSRVRGHDQREILLDIEQLHEQIHTDGSKHDVLSRLAKIRENLHRLWFDP